MQDLPPSPIKTTYASAIAQLFSMSTDLPQVNESGPMTFYIPPCADHLNLCDLIKKGGGKIAQKAGKDAINIVPESATWHRSQLSN